MSYFPCDGKNRPVHHCRRAKGRDAADPRVETREVSHLETFGLFPFFFQYRLTLAFIDRTFANPVSASAASSCHFSVAPNRSGRTGSSLSVAACRRMARRRSDGSFHVSSAQCLIQKAARGQIPNRLFISSSVPVMRAWRSSSLSSLNAPSDSEYFAALTPCRSASSGVSGVLSSSKITWHTRSPG